MRERNEKLAKQELAKAISRRSSSEERLRTSDAHIEQAHAEQRTLAASSPTVSATELASRQVFLERIEEQRKSHEQDLQQREAEVAERDTQLTAAASEHEMLNRLKERHRSEHDREAARRELNSLDEIAVVRFRRSTA